MPTMVEQILAPYDNAGQYAENISDMLDAIDRREVPFLALLGWSLEGNITNGADSLKYPCTQQQHTWLNDQLIPNFSTITGTAYAIGNTTITVATGEAAYFLEDAILVCTDAGSTTFWRVTTVPSVGDTLVVELISGDAAHPIGSMVTSLGRPAEPGETYATVGRVLAPTTDVNYTQIFGGGKDGVVAITGTELSTRAYGITDRKAYERAKMLQQLAIKLEKAAIMNPRSATRITARGQPASRMGGLYQYVAIDSGGYVQDAGGAQLATQENLLRTALDELWNRGGSPSVAMMNLFSRRQMSDLAVPFVRTARTETVTGVIVNDYEYTHGMLHIMLNKWVEVEHVWIISPEYLGIGPLNGNGNPRSFQVETLPKDGDYEREAVIGEYTMETRNRTAAHGLLKNLARS